MYYVYSDGKMISETTDWVIACDTAILYGGYVVDASDNEIMFCAEDSSPAGMMEFDDLELGFNPYMGCYDFDC